VSAIAARQYGLVTRAQLEALGFGTNVIARRVRSGAWIRVLPTVYRLASVVAGNRELALAATLWAGDSSVVSHETAGALWRITGVTARQVEIRTPRRLRSELVVVHRGTVEPRDRRMVDGIPVTSAARTIVDLSGRLDDETLEAAIDDVLHRGLTTVSTLRSRAKALDSRGRSGSGRVGSLLQRLGDGPASESRLETRVRRLLHGAGLRPVRQHPVVIDGRRYRLDFAWPELRVAVEPDGYAAHGGRGAFERDRRRWADLTSAGWRLVPVTWREISRRPEEFLRRVRALGSEGHAGDGAAAGEDGGRA
jgi:very-short-patch-repair endonuclease